VKVRIGIMQGRLSPPTGGRIQSFPGETWREEFAFARDAGLELIEWIYEAETEEGNPLRTEDGVAQIRRLIDEFGVDIESVCADYYMSVRMVAPGGAVDGRVIEHFGWLMRRAASLPVKHIVLPLVDSSSLRGHGGGDALVNLLERLIPLAESAGLEVHLETDLPPRELATALTRVPHPLIRLTYDIGNSAALGYDPHEELTAVGLWLGSVHVKDRLLGGGTVALGAGSADFETAFRLVLAAGFRGPFILQAARVPGVAPVELARRNRRFVEEQLARACQFQ
jgi:hexulose-6-phosphate isomerase